ncbi:MAG: hypothetical protein EZS28_036043, partial [Streblomastix strix]
MGFDTKWILQTVVFPKSGWIGVLSSDRRITFYDTNQFQIRGQIMNIPSLPTSMCVVSQYETDANRELLVLGRQDGFIDVFIMTDELMRSIFDVATQRSKAELQLLIGEKVGMRRDLCKRGQIRNMNAELNSGKKNDILDQWNEEDEGEVHGGLNIDGSFLGGMDAYALHSTNRVISVSKQTKERRKQAIRWIKFQIIRERMKSQGFNEED